MVLQGDSLDDIIETLIRPVDGQMVLQGDSHTMFFCGRGQFVQDSWTRVTVATNIVFLAFEQAVDHTNCVRRYWGKPDSSLQGGR